MSTVYSAHGSLLLHTCCGPCSTYVARWFADAGYQVTGFFYNPNIHPTEEYHKRRLAVAAWSEASGVPLVADAVYDPDAWSAAVGQNMAQRCAACYRLRLLSVARQASERGYDAFSTTLLISPHQQHEAIRRVGGEAAEKYRVPFIYRDFRPDFRQTFQLSRDLRSEERRGG